MADASRYLATSVRAALAAARSDSCAWCLAVRGAGWCEPFDPGGSGGSSTVPVPTGRSLHRHWPVWVARALQSAGVFDPTTVHPGTYGATVTFNSTYLSCAAGSAGRPDPRRSISGDPRAAGDVGRLECFSTTAEARHEPGWERRLAVPIFEAGARWAFWAADGVCYVAGRFGRVASKSVYPILQGLCIRGCRPSRGWRPTLCP
jgi:hypothetical protein